MHRIGVRRVWLLSLTLFICGLGSYISWRASTIALAQTPCPTSGGAPVSTLAVVPKGGIAPTTSAGDPCATQHPPSDTATLAPQPATPTLIGSPGTRIPLVKESSPWPLNTQAFFRTSTRAAPATPTKVLDAPIMAASISTATGKIAYMTNPSGSNYEIYTINPDGTNPTNVTNHEGDDGYMAWSSDGQQLAFSSARDSNTKHFWTAFTEIYVIHADGSVQRLTHLCTNSFEPAWSPDGSRLVFQTTLNGRWDIYTMPASGDGLTSCTGNPTITRLTSDNADHGDAVWSPDGSKIAFSTNRDGNHEIYVMQADGSGQTRLTNSPGVDWYPAWSPDGQHLAFVSNRSGNWELYVMQADGSNLVRLTNTAAVSESAPTWSPNGQYIAYVCGGICIIEWHGDHPTPTPISTNPTPITTSVSSDDFPAWTANLFPVLINLAYNQATSQSSTWPSGDAWHAVDGNTDGNWSHGSVSHTNNDQNAWWQVDLGAVRNITTIRLWNRSDCCADRLTDFYVFVSDNPFSSTDLATTLAQSGVWNDHETGQGGFPTTITVNRTGRYVRVQLAGTNYLSLAEVEVFGTPVIPTSTPTPEICEPSGSAQRNGALSPMSPCSGPTSTATPTDPRVTVQNELATLDTRQ